MSLPSSFAPCAHTDNSRKKPNWIHVCCLTVSWMETATTFQSRKWTLNIMFPAPLLSLVLSWIRPVHPSPLGGIKRAASHVSPWPLVPSSSSSSPSSLSSSQVSCSPLWRRAFQCDVLSRAGPEWLWQVGIAAVPRCLRRLTLPVQDDWGCLVALLPGLCRVRTTAQVGQPWAFLEFGSHGLWHTL